MQSIARLVNDLSELERVWEREPLLSTGLGSFDDVFCAEEAQRMIGGGLPAGACRLFRGGEPLPAERTARPVNPNARHLPPLADFDKVAARMARGYTLVLDGVQSYSPAVGRFAAALLEETGHEPDCTAFLTPPHSQGVAPHTDPVSLFLRQVHGAKRWRISAPAQRWPSRPWRRGDEARPVLDIWLEAGQCLYLPRGYVHVGETGELPSVHLAVSLPVPTWGRVLETAFRAAVAQAQDLREPLPPAFGSADREQLFHERMATLVAQLGKVGWPDVAPGESAAVPEPAPGALAAVLDARPEPR